MSPYVSEVISMKRRYIASHIFLVLAAAVAVFPILFIIANSFMSGDEIAARYGAEITTANAGDFSSHNIHFVNFGLLPRQATLEQYQELLHSPGYFRMFWNSVILVVPTLIGQCVLAPLTAYGFETIRWRYKEALYFLYIFVMLLPTQLLLVPDFIVAGWLHMRDSYLPIILPALFHPLGVFLVRQQLKNFPRECVEAAELDGAGTFQIYHFIVRPNLSSVVAALAVLIFADNWNIVDQTVVFVQDLFDSPLSFYLGNVMSEAPGMFFAVSVFYLLPALLVFAFGQEKLAEGITLSTIKS